MIIEALIGMLIFAFGLLALSGLQGSLTRAQTQSKARADAVYLASELIGAMWADMPHLSSYDTAAGCTSGSRCGDWKAKVGAHLPNGVPTVEVSTLTGEVQIRIEWTLARGGTHSYVTRTTIRRAA